MRRVGVAGQGGQRRLHALQIPQHLGVRDRRPVPPVERGEVAAERLLDVDELGVDRVGVAGREGRPARRSGPRGRRERGHRVLHARVQGGVRRSASSRSVSSVRSSISAARAVGRRAARPRRDRSMKACISLAPLAKNSQSTVSGLVLAAVVVGRVPDRARLGDVGDARDALGRERPLVGVRVRPGVDRRSAASAHELGMGVDDGLHPRRELGVRVEAGLTLGDTRAPPG